MSTSDSINESPPPTEDSSISCLDSKESSIASTQAISDVVAFSLCSLCSIRSNYLYPESYHEPFRVACVKRMVEYFKLPQKVEHSIREFVADDEFTFLSSIKNNYRDKVFRLIEELVLMSIGSGSYDARMHYLIVDVAELLGIPRELVEIHCESIYDLLLRAQSEEQTSDDDKYREKRDNRKKIKKYLMIGLASLGGGAVIGVTGGLAAPIVASAFGAALGTGAVVMSSAAAGVVGSLFGVAGAGLTASKMNKRIGDLEEFSFESLSPDNDQTSLTITIAISGWITDESEKQFTRPWKSLNHTKEQYCLRYESKYLLELSQAMDYLLSFVVSYAAQEALKYTFLAGVMAAIAWPTALISMANILDNPWDVCIGRSAQAGKHLADVLMSRQQGRRPVSLIGFSLGARVIFFCLQELAQRKNSEGIVCDVVILGAPVTASLDQWKPLARVISGQVINGYSSSDWLLRFLYRTTSAAIRVAGLQELCWQDKRVKNVDLTALVGGHMDYYKKLTEILDYVNIKTVVQIEDDLAATTAAISYEPTSQTKIMPAQVETDKSDLMAPIVAARGNSLNEEVQSTLSDSGIERTVSQSTNLSSSFSQQSLNQRQREHQQSIIDPSSGARGSGCTRSSSSSGSRQTTNSMGMSAPALVGLADDGNEDDHCDDFTKTTTNNNNNSKFVRQGKPVADNDANNHDFVLPMKTAISSSARSPASYNSDMMRMEGRSTRAVANQSAGGGADDGGHSLVGSDSLRCRPSSLNRRHRLRALRFQNHRLSCEALKMTTARTKTTTTTRLDLRAPEQLLASFRKFRSKSI